MPRKRWGPQVFDEDRDLCFGRQISKSSKNGHVNRRGKADKLSRRSIFQLLSVFFLQFLSIAPLDALGEVSHTTARNVTAGSISLISCPPRPNNGITEPKTAYKYRKTDVPCLRLVGCETITYTSRTKEAVLSIYFIHLADPHHPPAGYTPQHVRGLAADEVP